jgi:hypothetical protein
MKQKTPVDPDTVLAFGENFVFRYEKQDNQHLLLGLNDPEFGPVQVRIPLDVWHVIHQCGVRDLRLAETTDEHVEKLSESLVGARLALLHLGHKQSPNWVFTKLGGFEAFGPEDAPEEVQRQTGIASYTRVRAWERGIQERAKQHSIRRTVSSIDFGLFNAQVQEGSPGGAAAMVADPVAVPVTDPAPDPDPAPDRDSSGDPSVGLELVEQTSVDPQTVRAQPRRYKHLERVRSTGLVMAPENDVEIPEPLERQARTPMRTKPTTKATKAKTKPKENQ